ncbi:MAG: hypothetical protein HYU29_06305 [Chloroflexi bacterium]|nr:hypothetical protein [Chloroflexota bacterium]
MADPLARSILLVLINFDDPAQEEEFNRWYNEIHVPDQLEVPGFTAARRYVRIMEDKDNPAWLATELKAPKYLAIYEIEGDDPKAVLEKVWQHMEGKAARGHPVRFQGIHLMVNALYKRIL